MGEREKYCCWGPKLQEKKNNEKVTLIIAEINA